MFPNLRVVRLRQSTVTPVDQLPHRKLGVRGTASWSGNRCRVRHSSLGSWTVRGRQVAKSRSLVREPRRRHDGAYTAWLTAASTLLLYQRCVVDCDCRRRRRGHVGHHPVPLADVGSCVGGCGSPGHTPVMLCMPPAPRFARLTRRCGKMVTFLAFHWMRVERPGPQRQRRTRPRTVKNPRTPGA